MKVFTCLIVIRLISINCQQVLYKDLRGFQNTQFTNLKILENSLDSRSPVRSMLVCSGLCLENSRCLSCAFNNIMELCVLFSLLPSFWEISFIFLNAMRMSLLNSDSYYIYETLKHFRKHILFVSDSFLCRYPIILKCCISF